MIDVSELMYDPLFTMSCTLIRRNITPLENGRAEVKKDIRELTAIIQPMSDRQLSALNDTQDGFITSALTYYGLTKLFTAVPDKNESDQIMYKGVIYDVLQTADYKDEGGYYTAVLVRSK